MPIAKCLFRKFVYSIALCRIPWKAELKHTPDSIYSQAKSIGFRRSYWWTVDTGLQAGDNPVPNGFRVRPIDHGALTLESAGLRPYGLMSLSHSFRTFCGCGRRRPFLIALLHKIILL